MIRLTLTKHHGLGNDFLVLLGPAPDDLGALARRVCDRRRGVGADGLIVGVPADGPDVAMIVHNADGSRAELSGNGIRCLAQAVAAHRTMSTGALTIATDVGVRRVRVEPGPDAGTIIAAAEMGTVVEIEAPPGWAAMGADPARPVLHLSIGNPHTVVLTDDVEAADLEALGRLVADVNLEVVQAGPGRDALTMRVHERGVGVTEACGTGACAAAHAARRWGLVGRVVTVHMDGGDATVEFDDSDRATLVGPATLIATVEIEL